MVASLAHLGELFHISFIVQWFANHTCLSSINQSIFYYMSLHIEAILDPKKQQHIIIIYTNFP